jgi:ABC-type cobalt transport system substrate-binding protein
MTKKIIFTGLTLIAFYYCFRFGYIWTAYGHGGQLLGIPFALIMMTITIVFFFSRVKRNQSQIFIIGVIYFLTLAAFSITIEIIRAKMNNYFQFLYYEPGGYVNKIFFGWLVIGTIILFFKLRQIKNLKKEEIMTDEKG